MKRILPLILSAFALNAWGQVPVQVQTQSKNYDLSDAYRITFEDGGATQVIHTRSQGEIRVPMSDLKQIHFNDTTVSLMDQIMNLENCEIMKTILSDKVPNLPASFFWAYLNSPSVTKVFIPNDDAFQMIPYKVSAIGEVVSVKSAPGQTFPLKVERYVYDFKTGLKGRAVINGKLTEEEAVNILQRLILNQMMIENQDNAYTVAGSEVEKCDGEYRGAYQKNALNKEWENIPMVHVVQSLPGIEGKTCMVTDACAHESILRTYEVLQEIAPSFLSLMQVPVKFLADCGYIHYGVGLEISPEDEASVSFFENQTDNLYRFCWTSAKVGYTIFAPSDEAMSVALNNGDVYTWDKIQSERKAVLASGGSEDVIHEMISKTFAFIKRHICFRNAMVEVAPGENAKMVSCNQLSGGVPQTLSVRRESNSDIFEVSSSRAKSDPKTIYYVREPWDNIKDNVYSSSEYSVGVVMRMDKAIVDEN